MDVAECVRCVCACTTCMRAGVFPACAMVSLAFAAADDLPHALSPPLQGHALRGHGALRHGPPQDHSVAAAAGCVLGGEGECCVTDARPRLTRALP